MSQSNLVVSAVVNGITFTAESTDSAGLQRFLDMVAGLGTAPAPEVKEVKENQPLPDGYAERGWRYLASNLMGMQTKQGFQYRRVSNPKVIVKHDAVKADIGYLPHEKSTKSTDTAKPEKSTKSTGTKLQGEGWMEFVIAGTKLQARLVNFSTKWVDEACRLDFSDDLRKVDNSESVRAALKEQSFRYYHPATKAKEVGSSYWLNTRVTASQIHDMFN